jgi:tetratricopeptide (TPR) repeat protein
MSLPYGLLVCALAVLVLPREVAAQRDPFVDALIAFRAALSGTYGDEGPQVAGALDRMADSLAAWDREIAAVEADLRAGLRDAPPDEALRRRMALASRYVERGRLADALAELDAAIASDANRAASYLLRGLVREAAGAPADALQDFRRAWTIDQADPIKAYLLAARGLALGALDDPRRPIDALLAAQQAADRGRGASPAFIEVALTRDRADWPVFAPAAYAEGFALVAQGRYAEATASFRAAATRDPLLVDSTWKTGPMTRGILDLKERRFAAAIGHLETAVAAAPASSEARRLLGVAYSIDRREAESIDQLTTAVRLAPRDERARLALARTLITRERWGEAEDVLHDAIAALPQSAEARWALAQVYVQRDRGPEAIRELEMATTFSLLAGRGQLYWQLAELHRRHQDFGAMIRALTERARLDPNNPVMHKVLGLAHLHSGHLPEAFVELLMAALLAPEDPETLATIGQIHLDEGRYEPAEVILRRAVALEPRLAQARFALGTTLVRLGRAAEGREQLAEFQRLRDEELRAERREYAFETLLRDAERHASEGRLEEAIAALEQAAAINAADPRVYQQLASVYAKLGRLEDRARAQATYERLVREQSAAQRTAR